MTDYQVADAIKAGARTIADAMREQKPKLVLVPLIFAGASNLTDEQAHHITIAIQRAFEEALK